MIDSVASRVEHGLVLPEVPQRSRRCISPRRWNWSVRTGPPRRTWRRRMSAGWGSGRGGSTARSSSSSPGTRWSSARSTPPGPVPAGLHEQLRPALSRAGAGHWRAAAAPVQRLPGGTGLAGRARPHAVQRISRCFSHGMPPHGGFAIGWSDSCPGWSAWPTCARRPCSPRPPPPHSLKWRQAGVDERGASRQG